MRKFGLLVVLLLLGSLCFYGCASTGDQGLSRPQQEALTELLGAAELDGAAVQVLALPEAAAEKFPAVKKAVQVTVEGREYYAFAAAPLGYKDAVNLFVAIDGESDALLGVRVLQHSESPEYADYITQGWFLERFVGKSAATYLNRVVLEATRPNDVIQVTGATISSQAVINGVNAAMGVYQELVKEQEAPAVSLYVEGFVTEIKAGQ